jgi:hypothetical protein
MSVRGLIERSFHETTVPRCCKSRRASESTGISPYCSMHCRHPWRGPRMPSVVMFSAKFPGSTSNPFSRIRAMLCMSSRLTCRCQSPAWASWSRPWSGTSRTWSMLCFFPPLRRSVQGGCTWSDDRCPLSIPNMDRVDSIKAQTGGGEEINPRKSPLIGILWF